MTSVILARYGEEGAGVLKKYNPDYLFRNQLDEKSCLMDEHPTLAGLSKEYDKKFPVAWLVAQLHDLSEFCGCSNKLTGHALQQCANTISMEFYWLKLSELLLFFQKFKSGKYGRFYGSIDPLVITTSLRQFVKERNQAIDRYDQERKALADEEAKKNKITWEEYCEKNGRSGEIHPLKRRVDKKQKQVEDVEQGIRSAEGILSEYNLSESSRQLMVNMFKKKYGCEPKEYINKHKK